MVLGVCVRHCNDSLGALRVGLVKVCFNGVEFKTLQAVEVFAYDTQCLSHFCLGQWCLLIYVSYSIYSLYYRCSRIGDVVWRRVVVKVNHVVT